MNQKESYQTSQKAVVRECLKRKKGVHATAKDIYQELKQSGYRIGLTTVYRHLETMTKEGIAIKTIVDETTPACFEYTGHEEHEEHPCYHCKCVVCGKLIHLHCDEIGKVEHHIYEEHGFMVDARRTVFMGVCEACRNK